MHIMQIESVLQTKNRSEPAKNRFSVALPTVQLMFLYPGIRSILGVYSFCLFSNNVCGCVGVCVSV